MRKPILLPLSFSLLFFANCHKSKMPPSDLPPVTQEGKNTFGFTLNGKAWVPYKKCGSLFSSSCGEQTIMYGETSGPLANTIEFTFTRVEDNRRSDLRITSIDIGTITSTGNKVDSISVTYNESSGAIFAGPIPGSRFMITKLDSVNKIISGEFEFVLTGYYGGGAKMTLKSGRFDFKYPSCRCSE